jgi:hypothetical protein
MTAETDPFPDPYAGTYAGTYPEDEKEPDRRLVKLAQVFRRRRVRVLVESWSLREGHDPVITTYEVERPWERSFTVDALAFMRRWEPGRTDRVRRLLWAPPGELVATWDDTGLWVVSDRMGRPVARGVCARYLFRQPR